MTPSLINRLTTTPLAALLDVQRELDRAFDGGADGMAMIRWPAEVHETDEGMRFTLDVPGMKPEEIEITLENGILRIAGERKHAREESGKEGKYHVFERRYGRFEQSYRLPDRVDASRVEATTDNGVLTVTLPVAEKAKPRRVEIRPTGKALDEGA